MFYIKKLICQTKNNGTSTLDFTNGLNVIYGPSNTGKSLVIDCIDFMMAGKGERLKDSPLLFDKISMDVDVDGKNLHLERKIGKNVVEVTFDGDLIDDGNYYTTERSPNIKDLWLMLLGIEKEVQVIKNQSYEHQKLSIRTFIHMFIITEDRVVSEKSILESNNSFGVTAGIMSFLYLATGNNFIGDHMPNENKKIELRNQTIDEFVDRSLKSLEDVKINALKDFVEETDKDEILENINKLLDSMTIKQEDLDNALEESESITNELLVINDEIAESSMLQDRYKLLMSQYKADIRRLTFVSEGEIHKNNLKKIERCPFCNGELDKKQSESCLDAALKEIDKIELQIKDLESAEQQIVEDISALNSRKDELTKRQNELQTSISNELEPQIKTLKEMLTSYRIALGRIEVNNIFENIKDTLTIEGQNSKEEKQDDTEFSVKELLGKTLHPLMDNILNNLLSKTNYYQFTTASFNEKKYDLVVNGTEKATQGKGFRGFLNSVMAIAVQEYLNEMNKYPLRFMMIDSPILALVEEAKESGEDNTIGMRSALFKYLIDHVNDGQRIIIENELPTDVDMNTANCIEFTKTDVGRRGLIESYKK